MLQVPSRRQQHPLKPPYFVWVWNLVLPPQGRTWNISVNSPLKEVLRPNKELAKSFHLRFYVTSHLRLGLLGGPFHSLFPIKICMHFSLPHMCHMPLPTSLSLIRQWEYLGRSTKKWSSSSCDFLQSPVSSYFLPLVRKYLPQHPITM